MKNGKEIPTATELAMIAAHLYDRRFGRMKESIAALEAMSLWKACRQELDIEGAIEIEERREARRPLPFDDALRKMFTEQTAPKRESALKRLLDQEGVQEVLGWPNLETDEAITALKQHGVYRDCLERIKAAKTRNISKTKAANARRKK